MAGGASPDRLEPGSGGGRDDRGERASGPVAVVGVGVMGRAVVAALRQRGIAVRAADDHPTEAQRALAADLDVEFVGAPDAVALRELLDGATEVVPAPGLPEWHPVFALAAELGVPVVSELDLAGRWDDRPLVAITGTNGKTTVTMMVTAMLEAAGHPAVAAGNTDVPLVAALDDPRTELFVVEASSFRLAATRWFAPAVATWLNFAPDHLDVHRSLEAYEAAKARIWSQQAPDAVAVANLDDPVVAAHAEGVPARLVTYSVGRPDADWRVAGGRLRGPGDLDLLGVAELPRRFGHDLSNALAAAATAHAAGASAGAVAATLRTWRHLPHRVQLVGVRDDGVGFYDDSKATTPHAVLAALAGFPSAVLVAGGQNKGLDLSPLAAGADHVRAVVAIGAAAREVAEVFGGVRPVVEAGSMEEAVALADDLAGPGDVVLLSPGAASFDWYRSYGERGDDFTRVVEARLRTRRRAAPGAGSAARPEAGPGERPGERPGEPAGEPAGERPRGSNP